MLSITSFASEKPYPPVKIERQNPVYAREMLSNIGACNSEMSAVSLYIYNSTILKQNNPDFSQIFHKIAIVEMHHLDIFSQLAYMLGADPRLWTCDTSRPCYWSPACNHYPTNPELLLQNALRGEQDTILKYREQTNRICDAFIADLLNRIILDEQIHVEIYRKMLCEI